MEFKIPMNVEAFDILTGFRGIITGRVQYVTGCARYLLQPSAKEDGSWVESQWFDEDRVAIKTAAAPIVGPLPDRPDMTVAPGGDVNAPRK